VLAVACTLLLAPKAASAYSVLAHQAIVDAVWDDAIVPLLRQRFPGTSADGIVAARAYAYGGSGIQDLGYFPFGSKRFTNLVHYVRSGDFVEALIREATSAEEFAFALGALAHYACDNFGHPLAVNRAVPITYPKLRAQFGDRVLYAQSPAQHVMVEFAFDVLQVAGAGYQVQTYLDRIGFEVAKPVLERAFSATYGLTLQELFGDEDLAIATYRRAVSTIIPEMSRLAWENKEDEIRARTPGISRNDFVFTFTREQYEEQFGRQYRKPGLLTRVLFFLFKIVPKVGPLKPLAFEPLTSETERLFTDSFTTARDQYRIWLVDLAKGPVAVANTDFDTGEPPERSDNPLLEETYADLLNVLAERRFTVVPRELAQDINRHYGTPRRTAALSGKQRNQDVKARRLLAALNASMAAGG
jgi:zinc dependent phospholipase C